MLRNRIITENQLDAWVRGSAERAQGVIVELIWRLVAVSSPHPKERRFPLGDSIGQHGPDGVLNTEFAYEPFVPEGKSFWEVGTGLKARDKATSDYKDLVEKSEIDEEVRKQSTFIFVTPLSGKSDWEYSWKKDAQARWLSERRQRNDWRDVRVIDGTRLIDWLQHFPAVELWLAGEMGIPVQQIQTLEQRWGELQTLGDPPLKPQIFLTNRDEACAKLKEIFSGTFSRLQLDTYFPTQIADFVAAYVADMGEESGVDAVGHCLIISGTDAWNTIIELHDQHILVADFNLDEDDKTGLKLLENARKNGHLIIFGGHPGGIPIPHRASLLNPNKYQIQEALRICGYDEERARVLAQKSGGNIDSLLRCLQNLSLLPEWAQSIDVAELAIAEMLGSWKEITADRVVVESLSGNSYVEWIGKMRKVALQPGTPLTQRDGVWKFVARYEGWYALGPWLFDEHLDRLRTVAVDVLGEQDPRFELPPEERFMASIHGKVLSHSPKLRKGLAECLALLGSHPEALISCSGGKAEGTARVTVREILADASWVQWASLQNLLPLLAEAAPREFMDAVENALNSDPCPFEALFAQEGSGIMGTTYMSGLLWALETLAWDPEYFTRVVVILGELGARDPGGNYENRPENSLTTILLPWFPQTCAPIEKRKVAVKTLIRENPDVAWKLLLSLLPLDHQFSSESRRPAWRNMIPDDWSKGVTGSDYWDQVAFYADLAINVAKSDLIKLADLIDHFDNLPFSTRGRLLDHLRSSEITSLPETEKLSLWTKLLELVTKHRQYADADWAMKPEQVDKIADVTKALEPDAPELHYQHFFSDRSFELFEEEGDYEEQCKKLGEARQQAVDEIFKYGGVQKILKFAECVESPWAVGFGFGTIAEDPTDQVFLPDLLETESQSLLQFTGGFVMGRFHAQGWEWIDRIDLKNWNNTQVGQFLAYLPFNSETWKRVSADLREDESPYWSRANATPYQEDRDLEYAISRLILYCRPLAAVRCLYGMKHRKKSICPDLTAHALVAAVNSKEMTGSMDPHIFIDLIKALQKNPIIKQDDILRVEWAYLPLFDHRRDASPKLLGQRLANAPRFFCDIIRTAFRSKKKENSKKVLTETEKNIAINASRLLRIWKTPPGYQEDGNYNSDALVAWLNVVKKECKESGHLDIAMLTVGQVLIHAPPDPDGLWIHHSVAEVLNAKDAEKMRNGFRIALFNSRGVHRASAGKQERALAEKYRNQAEEVENRGYSRLAGSLRILADSYERDAEWEEKEDLFDE